MEGGDRILVAAGLTAAVVVGAFVLWGPGGAPRARKRRGQISGLQNLGRTCFLNTLLQALAACPAFVRWLRAYSGTAGGRGNSMITTLYTVIEVVNGTHAAARGTAVCPLGVLQALGAAGWVVPRDQQDAHELMHVLLGCLEEEVQAGARKPGCLSDALAGLGGSRAWSALASPASPPALPLAPRADSTPPTPSAASARAALAAPHDVAPEPDLVDPEPPPPGPLGGAGGLSRLRKGVSRSFCQLAGAGRRLPSAAPRPAPQPPPFRGTLASRLQCTACNHKSPIRYDKFDSISLPLTSASAGLTGTFSLAGLLRALTAPELVKGVRCGKCETEGGTQGEGQGQGQGEGAPCTRHIRTVSFGKLPACLCLHIARVQWVAGALSKRSDHVSFPETLCLAPYAQPTQHKTPDLLSLTSGGRLRGELAALNVANGATNGASGADGADERTRYTLVAVVVHVGGPRSGHFATYRRGNGFEAKRWWYTSDTLVHEVALGEVLRAAAYMLFYERTPSAHASLPPVHASLPPAHASLPPVQQPLHVDI